MKEPATSSTASSSCCRPLRPTRRRSTASSRLRSSAGRTSARVRCSTRCSARSARSSPKCRARRATRSTRCSFAARATLRLIDTAGVHKKPEAHGAIEYYAALRSLKAIARCDIALLVFDAMTGVTAQDRRLAGLAIEERKGLILVGNKWDLVREQGEFSQGELAQRDPRPHSVRAICAGDVSLGKDAPALGQPDAARRSQLPPTSTGAFRRRSSTRRFATRCSPIRRPRSAEGSSRCTTSSQPATHPPLFVFSCNDPDLLQSHYRRFLENVIRQHFDFEGVPLTLEFRPRREDAERRERASPRRRRRGVPRRFDPVRLSHRPRILSHRPARRRFRQHRRDERAAHARQSGRRGGAAARRAQRIRSGALGVARTSAPAVAEAIVAAAAVLGHCFSPWLRWRGGKGVATSFGAIFAMSWPAGLVAVGGWIAGALLTQYSSVGSMLGSALAAVAMWFFTGSRGADVLRRSRGDLHRVHASRKSGAPASRHRKPDPPLQTQSVILSGASNAVRRAVDGRRTALC